MCELGKTAIFRRTTADLVVRGIAWRVQPYNKELACEPETPLGRLAVRTARRVLPYLPAPLQAHVRRLRPR